MKFEEFFGLLQVCILITEYNSFITQSISYTSIEYVQIQIIESNKNNEDNKIQWDNF